MAVDDIAVLRIVGRYQDQNIVNTMHYKVDTQTTGDEQLWDDLVNGFWTAHNTLWTGRHSDAYEWVGLKAFTRRGDTRPPGERTIGVSGDVVGTPQVSFCCRTITFYSDDPNPRRRGRLMLSGGDEAMFWDVDGAVTSGEIILLTALGVQLMDNITENGNVFEPILYAKATDNVSGLVAAKGRSTPSSVRSRRIRRMLIG